jgi:hypothetical protein
MILGDWVVAVVEVVGLVVKRNQYWIERGGGDYCIQAYLIHPT